MRKICFSFLSVQQQEERLHHWGNQQGPDIIDPAILRPGDDWTS
jgi:hypothetical protein